MANQRREVVGYQPFRVRPLLAEGLLPVARSGGEFMERVASAMFRMADQAGVIADRQAEAAGRRAGQQAALDGRPGATVSGGDGAALDGDHRSIAASILRKEEGFRETPYWDVNAFRTGYGSDTITTTDGKVVRVEKGMRVSREDAERDLGRRLGEFEQRAASQVGVENWNRLPPAARGALLSTTYNYGSLPKSVVGAVRGGDVAAVAAAVEGLSANKGRRRREAGVIRGGGNIPAGAPVAAPTAQMSFTGGTFRPTGRDTVYGRAFDEAGTRTYVQMLETEMRSTSSQLFDRYKDDPVKLAEAFNDLKGEMAREHVFPEILADFEVGFGSMAERYVGQARDNLARRIEAQDRADFVERTATLETEQKRRLVDFDPSSPDAADAIAASQAAIDDHYDSAVDRGILDPDDAERAKIASRREAALGFYGKQAEALDADGIARMRKAMAEDFGAGELEGLDGDGWQTLDRGLQKLETSKRNEARREASDFRQRGDQMAARIASGYEINTAEMSKFMLDAGSTSDGKAAMQESLAKISAGRAIRDFSVRQGEAHVAGLRKQYGDKPTDGQLRILAFTEGMLEKKKRAIATDPVSYAEAQNIVPATPMLTEAQSVDDMEATMVRRVESAEEAAGQLGATPRYLKAGEAKAVAAAVKADPAAGASIAAAIVAGAGNRAAAVLSEFGSDAPMIAESGAILAFGGSAAAAQDVIAGYGKGTDGKQLKGLKPETERENTRAVTGTALAYASGDASRIARAASAITRARVAEQNLDPTSDEALQVHAQAVQEAAGAVFDRGQQYGGFADFGGGAFSTGSKVLVPSAIRADLLEELVGAITDEDLAALPVKPKAGIGSFGSGKSGGGRVPRGLAASLRGAVPVVVDRGFAFAFGDPGSDDPQFVRGDNGEVFVLDIVAMRDRLAPRVPGAFR